MSASGISDRQEASRRSEAPTQADTSSVKTDEYLFEADLYDVLWAHLNQLDLALLLELTKEFGGPILELGCGTGRTLFPSATLAGSGVGVDLSPSMLKRAELNRQEAGLDEHTARLVHGDMRTIRLGEKFPFVTSPGQSFFHLATDSDWLAALETVREHLAPGGRFFSGVQVFRFDLMAQYNERYYLEGEIRDPRTGNRIVRWDYNTFDLEQQSGTRRRVNEIIDEDGKVLERRHTFRTNYFRYPNEIRHLLKDAGCRIEREYGDYERNPYQSSSSHYVWVATVDS